ncbi:hypothetical protein [Nonomuraea diastatica]|uniref:Exonuclease domain-containing protein n=1 Tax=Nonomuraea diastatica TaxID=1848329 RepID=A0A4R4WZ71_9ACTN|nr:hypothetical protein [Nonomuraea diastatica]TDD23130.1 hypothetical protein E1294_09865 [Nonomuraea diastatica]
MAVDPTFDGFEGIAGVDGETTGRDPFLAKTPDTLWEYAIVIPHEGARLERVWEFWPEAVADPEFLAMSNFSRRRHPLLRRWGVATLGADGSWRRTSRREAATEIAALLQGRHIVGIVPGFDDMFLRALLCEYNLRPSYHYHVICAEVHVRGFIHGWHAALAAAAERLGKPAAELVAELAGPPLEVTRAPWDADRLLAAVGAEPPQGIERHSALADARWALEAYLLAQAPGPWMRSPGGPTL